MSTWNLALRPAEERQAMEDEKARLFEFWQLNLDRAKGEAGKLFAERSKRKGKWSEWAQGEVAGGSPPELQSLVRSELEKLVAADK
ncbi:hypothetical protein N7414_23060 [Pseudomonas sp. GD04087]|uniref:hypothetical protein n=1 Tax=unclassified Pseudomonas TaxID=196821 RepID=UPI00244CDAE2|nr:MULTISPECIES: hypothetical protein [unclassified Pseudomonas]MDH0292014.1 hypothetical protein [Pseudomonas sp. GD04087]MDH1052862.1 hypothetical protein [Pseudomonas sp. GD03903]MDH2002025.1 hypothetical protein [Pseudomonas sp. GD03691]